MTNISPAQLPLGKPSVRNSAYAQGHLPAIPNSLSRFRPWLILGGLLLVLAACLLPGESGEHAAPSRPVLSASADVAAPQDGSSPHHAPTCEVLPHSGQGTSAPQSWALDALPLAALAHTPAEPEARPSADRASHVPPSARRAHSRLCRWLI